MIRADWMVCGWYNATNSYIFNNSQNEEKNCFFVFSAHTKMSPIFNLCSSDSISEQCLYNYIQLICKISQKITSATSAHTISSTDWLFWNFSCVSFSVFSIIFHHHQMYTFFFCQTDRYKSEWISPMILYFIQSTIIQCACVCFFVFMWQTLK